MYYCCYYVDTIATAYRLASLRFLQPRHWCVECLADGGGYGREWELAQRELCRLVEVITDSYKALLKKRDWSSARQYSVQHVFTLFHM
jgi:hypothetical protein